MKTIINFFLKKIAQLYLKKFKPRIIAITGSVGKTSTKDAIYLALKDQLNVRASEKSYNNEIGVPLTIIGFKSPAKNFFFWLLVLIKSFFNLFFIRNYPEVLILEMGSDKPGDLEKLIQIAKPDISVITKIGYSHYQAFESMQKLVWEKTALFRALGEQNWAVFSLDDRNLQKINKKIKGRILSFGLGVGNKIFASDIKLDSQGLFFKINYKKQSYPIHLLAMGEHIIYVILAAFAVGIIFNLKPKELIKNLSRFEPLPGRGKMLQGKNKMLIIDESYNANPMSMKAALNFFKKREWPSRKVAILGDMKELGSLSKKYHLKLAQWLKFLDLSILVGEESRITFNKLVRLGKQALYFEKVDDLISDLDKILLPEDLILVKGSQVVRLEKAIELLLSSIYEPKKVLVRQEKEWR